MKENRLWIVPNNDLETKAIINILGKNNEDYLITKQSSGASWKKLEKEIKIKVKEARENEVIIYGVELQGNVKGTINIDHHIYGNENRSNTKSSIEQVAEILEVNLTVDEMFISANDKGYIPEMQKLGSELKIKNSDLDEIISNIRIRTRKMQGVTIEQELQAQEAIKKLGKLNQKRKYISVDLPHSKPVTVADRLYGKYDNLLIATSNGETNFYGQEEIVKMLNEKFPGGLYGGQLKNGNGFWKGYANQDEIKNVVQEMIENKE